MVDNLVALLSEATPTEALLETVSVISDSLSALKSSYNFLCVCALLCVIFLGIYIFQSMHK